MSKPIQGVLKVRRPIHGILPLNSEGKQVDRLVNNVKAADSYKKLLCCLACLRLDVCMMCKLDSLMESTYVQAWENKLEYNYPMIVCCCMVRRTHPGMRVGEVAAWRVTHRAPPPVPVLRVTVHRCVCTSTRA